MLVKIANINIHGIKTVEKRNMLKAFCLDRKLDIVGLQEVTFSSCDLLEEYFIFVSNIGPRERGTGLLIRKTLDVSNVMLEPEGRLIRATINSMVFVIIYAPSGKVNREDRQIFFSRTLPAYAALIKEPVTIMGDFNAVDLASDRQQQSSARVDRGFVKVIKSLELTDVWRMLRPDDAGHTFHHPRGSSRIDRVFTTAADKHCFRNIETVPAAFTDHLALESVVEVGGERERKEREPSGWRLNVAFLQEE